MAHLEPQALGISLLAATLLPALQGELDPESAALQGNLGVLEDLGARSLRGFVVGLAQRLRARERMPVAELQVLLYGELQNQWQAGGENALALRRDASRLLQAVDGVEAAMTARSAEVKKALARGLAGLGQQFGEFRWMLEGVEEALADVRALQFEQLSLQREQLAKTEEILQLQRAQVSASVPSRRLDAARPPAFLETDEEEYRPPIFVARDRELSRLGSLMERVLAGQGSVVFVTGGPGRGKTALLAEFARRAMEVHHNLLVVSGNCNAYSGVGDPFLPFREAMAMLSGEVEARWAAGTISRDHATRLWAALPLFVEALLDHGPHLLDVLVPGVDLLVRAAAAAPVDAPWLAELRRRVEQSAGGSEGLEQAHLFQQLTNMLRALSERHPLLIMLDDLQWADRASIGLLFHLGRRLAPMGGRILIASAYRPEEVALGRRGERHPLEKVLFEFKRTLGDVCVDLTEGEELEKRRFVEAYVETESNRLGEDFRGALFNRTGGHPLFTVELLRTMQERGDLVKDEAGCWAARPKVDWETLPDRVEGVVGERIGRLESELQDTLSIASVEGKVFTAQVVARVRDVDEHDLARRLSRELDKRHRLVREEGIQQVGEEHLYLYRFRHNLIHQHLYNGLGSIERNLLHGEIGYALEALFGADVDQAAARLAFHFGNAGIQSKAVHYLIQAGHQAKFRYAHQEAIDHYDQALAMVPAQDRETRFDLLLSRERAHAIRSDRKAQAAGLAALASLADELGDRQKQAKVALRQALYAEATSDYLAAISSAQRATRLAQECGDLPLEVTGQSVWGRVLAFQGNLDEADAQLRRALDLVDIVPAVADLGESLPISKADALNNLAYVFYARSEFAESRARLEDALLIYCQAGSRSRECSMLMNLGHLASEQGDHDSGVGYYKQALRAFREMGHRRSEAQVLQALANASTTVGMYSQAAEYYREVLTIIRECGDRQLEAFALDGLGFVAACQNRLSISRNHYERALTILRDIGAEHGLTLSHLGDALLGLDDVGQAAEAYQHALDLLQEAGCTAWALDAKEGLARVALRQGNLDRAQWLAADILACLKDSESSGDKDPQQLYLTCYRILVEVGDKRALAILTKAHAVLQERASNISDKCLRRSFLENVPANREILAEWATIRQKS
jgi:tetratricopeptide (TPR) repeat protein